MTGLPAPNDNSVGPGTRKYVLGPDNLTSPSFTLNTLGLLSGNRQSNNRIAIQMKRSVPSSDPIPTVELQARIPTAGGIMGWDSIPIVIGGNQGNFWQGELNHALEVRFVMDSTNAAVSTVLIQAS